MTCTFSLGKPDSSKTMSGDKGYVTADAVPSNLKFEEDAELSPRTNTQIDDYSYNIRSAKCGTCIVFNNMQFDKITEQNIR